MAFVICLIPTLGIEVLMIVRLLQVLHPVDVHQDGLGLWGCSELQVYFPHHIRDGVDTLPLLDELPIRRSWFASKWTRHLSPTANSLAWDFWL